MDHSEVQFGCQQWRLKKLSRAERFQTMENISLIIKRKNEIRSKARAVVPNISKNVDEATNRVKEALERITKEAEDASTSED